MKEQIYTIPLNESFDSGDECPFCFLERNVERSAINYAVGPEASYMESDVRGLTNEQGFCTHHMKSLYDYGNSLGSALILQSYYKLLMDDFRDQLEHFDQPAKRGLFSKSKQNSDDTTPPLVKWSRRRQSTCYVCGKIESNMQRYYETFFMMSKTEDFRRKVESSKGFCMRHFGELVASAQSNLPNGQREWFYQTVFSLMKDNMDRVKADLDDFVGMFDYHQQNTIMPANTRDALSRSMQKLKGLHPADPPFKGK
ncbi:MAG: hypothetical protein IKE00_01305 [Oscillospiraceae bacterium]|nr:hypothetical protein [Oscillospiraceae bacterium]